jgi:hypothetical protein
VGLLTSSIYACSVPSRATRAWRWHCGVDAGDAASDAASDAADADVARYGGSRVVGHKVRMNNWPTELAMSDPQYNHFARVADCDFEDKLNERKATA